MENLKFEKFTSLGNHFANTINLNKSGGFHFSGGFCRENNILEQDYIVLFYDEKKLAIGFVFRKESVENSYRIIRNAKTAFLSPRSFINAYKINPKIYYGKYKPYQQKSDDGENIFYILLTKK